MKKPPVDRKKRTNNRILRCILLVAALVLYLMSVHTYFRHESLKERATLVEGEVIYIREGDVAKDVFVEFFYEGEIYGIQYDKDYGSAYTLGDKVSVYIDPRDPETRVDTSGAGTAIILWCVGGAILLTAAIGLNERRTYPDYCTTFNLTRTYIHADLCRKLKYDRVWLIFWMLTLSAGGLCYLCFPYRKALIGTAVAAGVFLCMAIAATCEHCKIAGSIKGKDYTTEKACVIKKEVHQDMDSTEHIVICAAEENEQYTVRVTRKEYALVEGGDEMLFICLGYKQRPYLGICLKDKKVFYQVGRKRRK